MAFSCDESAVSLFFITVHNPTRGGRDSFYLHHERRPCRPFFLCFVDRLALNLPVKMAVAARLSFWDGFEMRQITSERSLFLHGPAGGGASWAWQNSPGP